VDDLESDFKQIKVSRLTLGLIMTVATVSAVIVWNAAAVSNKINTLSADIEKVQTEMEEYGEPDSQVLTRLDSIERMVEGFDTQEIGNRLTNLDRGVQLGEERLDELEELVAEINELLYDGEIRWQLDDLFWRTDGVIQALETRQWGEDFIKEWFGHNW
jgi:hypothetical protein